MMGDETLLVHLGAGGARRFEYQGAPAVHDFGDAEAEYRAARETAALFPLTWRGALRFVGPDRRSWLHGQVTNEVNRLADGAWNEAAIINIQGRMVADLRIFALPDALLADLPAAIATATAEHLDRYLIMERVEIENATADLRLLSVQGPRAAEAVRAATGVAAAEIAPHTFVAQDGPGGAPLLVARASQTGEPGFDLFVATEAAPLIWDQLAAAVRAVGGRPAGWAALNTRRVEAGIPWWGHELDSSIVPLEARLERAISLTKGCYVGQEIIARIDARGQVNNLLGGLRLAGETLPEPGSDVWSEEKRIGRITTAVHSPTLAAPIALAFLRREWTEPGRSVWVESGGERQPAMTHALPFVGGSEVKGG
jgi:glycine cleavage system T protein (aminomethyltransferase)